MTIEWIISISSAELISKYPSAHYKLCLQLNTTRNPRKEIVTEAETAEEVFSTVCDRCVKYTIPVHKRFDVNIAKIVYMRN